MKHTIGILLITMLLQSCMTYKSIGYEDIDTNKKIVFQLPQRGKNATNSFSLWRQW